jgi:spermidine synthase
MRPIATIASPISGEIVVYRHSASGLLTYTQGGYEQSAADRNGVSTASYIHALYGLVLQSGARTALMIGCGGGTLAAMLARAGTRVSIVDCDPASFDLARWYFGLPESCTRHVADARAFLESSSIRYDAIVHDAYDAGAMPAHLADTAFFELIKRRLNRGGAVFVNAYTRDDSDPFPRETEENLLKVWRDVRTLDLPGRPNRNTIVMAGAVSTLAQPTLVAVPEVEADDIKHDLAQMTFTYPRPRQAKNRAPAGRNLPSAPPRGKLARRQRGTK